MKIEYQMTYMELATLPCQCYQYSTFHTTCHTDAYTCCAVMVELTKGRLLWNFKESWIRLPQIEIYKRYLSCHSEKGKRKGGTLHFGLIDCLSARKEKDAPNCSQEIFPHVITPEHL